MPDIKIDFEHPSIADALKQLNVDPQTGLVVVDAVKVAMFHRLDLHETGQAGWQNLFHARLDTYHGRPGKLAPRFTYG